MSEAGRRWKWKEQMLTLYYGLTDPAAPWVARIVAILSLLYLLSPIDLIPDMIPFAGWVDDLIIVPVLFGLSARLLPHHIRQRARATARKNSSRINSFLLILGIIFILITILLMLKLKRLLATA